MRLMLTKEEVRQRELVWSLNIAKSAPNRKQFGIHGSGAMAGAMAIAAQMLNWQDLSL